MVSVTEFTAALDRIRAHYAEHPAHQATLSSLSKELGLSLALCAAAVAVLVNRHELTWDNNVLIRSDGISAPARRRTA